MPSNFEFLIYNTAEGDVSVNAVVKDETIWLTQKAMAQLFGVETPAISKHLANVYAEGELKRDATVSKMEIVQAEGTRQVTRLVDFYNLDAIISVGYRVNSRRATPAGWGRCNQPIFGSAFKDSCNTPGKFNGIT